MPGASPTRGRRFEEVLTADPDNREALRHYSALLSETLETSTRRTSSSRSSQGLDPDDADVPFRRALNFLEARRLDEAETILRDLRGRRSSKKETNGRGARSRWTGSSATSRS